MSLSFAIERLRCLKSSAEKSIKDGESHVWNRGYKAAMETALEIINEETTDDKPN